VSRGLGDVYKRQNVKSASVIFRSGTKFKKMLSQLKFEKK
jgi:hypothetical protein